MSSSPRLRITLHPTPIPRHTRKEQILRLRPLIHTHRTRPPLTIRRPASSQPVAHSSIVQRFDVALRFGDVLSWGEESLYCSIVAVVEDVVGALAVGGGCDAAAGFDWGGRVG